MNQDEPESPAPDARDAAQAAPTPTDDVSSPTGTEAADAVAGDHDAPPAEAIEASPSTDVAPPVESDPADVTTPPDEPEEPAARRRRRLQGAALFAVGFLALLLHHALSFQVPRGALLGLVSTALAATGLLHALGYLRPSSRDVPLRATPLFPLEGEPLALAPIVTFPAGLAIALVSAFAFGTAALPLGIGLLVACLVPMLSGLRRPAILPVLVLAAIYLPRLGDFALWDPWETHYGEVAREILGRDDWISLWWGQEYWFWSKPILIFWAEAWSMSALGIDFTPDAHPAALEWALRLPVFVMSLAAVAAVQMLTSRAFGRRAGIFAALVVGSMPHFYLLAHQAITDMPLSAALTVSIAALGLALLARGDELPTSVRVGAVAVSSRAATVFGLLLFFLPQISYLISRNMRLDGRGLVFRLDKFLEGSAGNYMVPGNVHYTDHLALDARNHPTPLQPAVQGLVFALLLAGTLFLIRNLRTRRDVAMIVFYVACAFGLVGKGIPGVALPGLVALLYLVVSGRWSLLTRGSLHVVAGILITLGLGLPWYVAMTVRHGRGFLDRIVVHDHINRLAKGVHGENGPIDYFLSQLGYATFPWVGLVPVALLAFVYLGRRAGERDEPRPHEPAWAEREVARLVGLWGIAAFTLFSAMVTKFHHYIFPVVPPAGLLVGVVLDKLAGKERHDVFGSVVAAIGTLALVVGIGGATGSLRGVAPAHAAATYVGDHPLPLALVVVLIVGGLGLFGYAAYRMRPREDDGEATSLARGLAAAALGGALIAAFVGRDLSWVTAQRPAGQERFALLFTYLYTRPFPEYVDYRPVMTGFSVVCVGAIALVALPHLRRAALRAALVSALALTAFSVNVYLPDVARHWSTKGLIDRYYHQRRPNEPLLAFQMNWKGENLYTGNRVHVFQDLDTSALRNFFGAHRGETMYVLVEHTRFESFRANLPPGSTLSKRSTERDNNKFVLGYVRVAPPSG